MSKKNWGSQPPQPSNTPSGWGTAPQPSDTPSGARVAAADAPEYDSYTIEGVKYKVDKIISKTSGEAKIFQISSAGKSYVLKLYKPQSHPNHQVLDIIQSASSSGLVVALYAHGLWHDEKTGLDHDYEIMQNCDGGSLASLTLKGDEKKLKEIASRMALTLNFLHHKGVLHRDIKPANFLFTDSSHTSFVLTDFGLAKTFDSKGLVETDSGRTKIYAAPEMYRYVPGSPTYVGAKSDFFSMGMTLLALWTGEGLYTADEAKLVDEKMEEGLPYPSSAEMSEHTLSLLKALTRRNPEKRAGADEIARWAEGEIIWKDPNAPDDSIKPFKIVFSAGEGLIAHTPAELSKIMWEHKTLATKYLYSDTIKKWLEDVERPELALVIEEITEMRYPDDREAGLYAACLELDQEMPFYGMDGSPLVTNQEIAKDIYHNIDEYSTRLSSPTDPLWVYFRSAGQTALADSYPSQVKTLPRSSTRKLICDLDPTLPYRFVSKGYWTQIKSLQEFAEGMASGKFNEEDIGWQTNEDFLTWAVGQNKAVAGKVIKSLEPTRKKCSMNKGHAWYAIYALLPGYGYDFKPLKESELGDAKSIAYRLSDEYYGLVKSQDILSQVKDPLFGNTRLRNYLWAQGCYSDQISWIQYCMDLNSSDNKKKCGPYCADIAIMKTISGLIGTVVPLYIKGTWACDFKEFESKILPMTSSLNGPNSDRVAYWLSLFFQEDPWADYSKKSYRTLTFEYHDYLMDHLEYSGYIRICNVCLEDLDEDDAENDAAWGKVKSIKWLLALLCFVPMVLACVVGAYLIVTQGSEHISAMVVGAGGLIGVIAGIIVGFIMLGNDWGWLFSIGGGFLASIVVKIAFSLLGFVAPWLLIAVFVAVAIFFGVKIFKNTGMYIYDQYTNLDWGDAVKYFLVGSAFGTMEKLLPKVPKDYPYCVLKESTEVANEQVGPMLKNGAWMLGITGLVVGLCFVMGFNVKKALSSEVESAPEVETVLSQDGGSHYEGTINGSTKAELSLRIEGSMYKGVLLLHYASGDSSHELEGDYVEYAPSVTLYKVGNKAIKMEITPGKDESGTFCLTGSYTNSKGNVQPFKFSRQ